MQKIQIIIAEVLLCNILNVWFQKHFIHVSLFKKGTSHKFQIFLTLVQEKWPKMLSSFDAAQSEVSLCTIWLQLNQK